MDDFPCVVIAEADCKRAAQRSAGTWGDTTWVDDHQAMTRSSLRWNGLLAEVSTLRHLGYQEIGGWDGGVDMRGRWGTAQIKFRSANRYGLSRPISTRRMSASYTLLVVPACSYLDHKVLRQDDQICLAGWVSRDEFYRLAEPRAFFGKPHLFMDQPLRSMTTWPGLISAG